MPEPSGGKIALLLGVILVVGAGIGTFYFKSRADAMEQTAEVAADKRIKLVDAYAVVPRSSALNFRNRGMVKGIQEVRVSAEVAGKVIARPIREGQTIEVGQVICQIDPTFHQLAVEEARANVAKAEAVADNAQAELQRVKNMAEEHRPFIELNRRSEAVAQANATRDQVATLLKQANERLDRCQIKSPISGTVSTVLFEEGELLAPGQPVAEVVDLNQMRLVVGLTELEVARLGQEPTISITSMGLGDLTFQGRIRAIYPKASVQTRRIPVEILVENHKALLRSGTMVDCSVKTEDAEDQLLIPAKGVLHEFGEDFCLLAVQQPEGFAVARRTVRTTPVPGSVRWLQVLDGLQPGDLLILSHHQELHPGEIITVRQVEPNEA